ncbi:hypothetical protein A2765_03080 [Candidatus Kaiserbacteria bacterium RIFCSPHIGHO2_01_FULL_56_24]|uniref:Uncharacterized protein n=1 Tax=Candidatus Kaiserbacteria bacterium RIFCSPHIGHO2_01_FULL_56_24 TaxID=1798487 RepID=A0A1F6DGG1_9BACT|nr:MAG: hypothetical protein A2765_03080 [Candidatus Kaiserbacteria bacterium RIFCSPHIGHO2_01_FULL_56_24]
MEAGQELHIKKPSFWSGTRELFNEHGGKVGTFRMLTLLSWRKAEGEAGGKTLRFSYSGWNTHRSQATDEWGRVVGTMHRSYWCGTNAQLILHEKEYLWHANLAGTHFSIEETDGTEVIRVTGCGGFGMKGSVRILRAINTQEAIELIYMGLYQMRLFEAEVAATTAIVAGPIAI